MNRGAPHTDRSSRLVAHCLGNGSQGTWAKNRGFGERIASWEWYVALPETEVAHGADARHFPVSAFFCWKEPNATGEVSAPNSGDLALL